MAQLGVGAYDLVAADVGRRGDARERRQETGLRPAREKLGRDVCWRCLDRGPATGRGQTGCQCCLDRSSEIIRTRSPIARDALSLCCPERRRLGQVGSAGQRGVVRYGGAWPGGREDEEI